MNNLFLVEKLKRIAIAKNEEWVIQKKTMDIPFDDEEYQGLSDVIICVSTTEGDVVATNIIPEDPEGDITSWMLEIMISPIEGKPRRPGFIVLAGDNLKCSEEYFTSLGIDVETTSDTHPVVDMLITQLEKEMKSPGLPPYTFDEDHENVESTAAFFKSTADLYELKFWKFFEYEVPLKLDFEVGDEVTSYWVLIMGGQSNDSGFAVYKSYEELSAALDAESPEEVTELMQKTWSMAVNYLNTNKIGLLAKQEYEEHGWIVAGKNGYPSAIVTNPDSEDLVSRPTIAEIDMLNWISSVLVVLFTNNQKKIKRFLKDDSEIQITAQVLLKCKKGNVSVNVSLPASEYIEEMYEDDPFGDDSDED